MKTFMTWHGAAAYCVEQGAKLVSLESAEEVKYIDSILKTDHSKPLWTGGVLSRQDHQWYWLGEANYERSSH